MGIKFTNNAEGLLNANINDSVTTLTLQANQGDYFPVIVSGSGDYFYATLVDTSGNVEVIKVTERQDGTDVFQVMERAAEAFQNEAAPFTARSFVTNDKVQLRPTAASIPDIRVLTDDEVIQFGDGPDAQLMSNGTSFVVNNGAGTETMISATPNGPVDLYYNDIKVFETESDGITVTGTVYADGLYLEDNELFNLGTGTDISIYFDSTSLVFETILTETMLAATPNGSVDLYYNNSKKLETTNTGATITGVLISDGLALGDNEDITLGAGPDAKISSNGTALVIENGAGTETMLTATQNGSVALYHNNIIAMETSTSGIRIFDTSGNDPLLAFRDDANNTVGYIQYLDSVLFITVGGETVINATLNGATGLYYNNDQVMRTLDDGIEITAAGGVGCITLPEGNTPTADANKGKVYTKSDNKIYFQDGAGVEHEIAFV